ncbi:MAG: hypothetical protein B7Z55_17180 [Planctomycetales bacterium 12-60-4]|nr:MAG: hypothetical protein B7Z55_17180 [Planctomycetales bacterium 12-60-4]
MSLAAPGCAHFTPTAESTVNVDNGHYSHLARQIEFPDEPTPADDMLVSTVRPASRANISNCRWKKRRIWRSPVPR